MNHFTIVVQKALHYVCDYLNENEIAPGDRLPPIAILAQNAGVSRLTMRKALQALDSHDLIDITQGRAIQLKLEVSQWSQFLPIEREKQSRNPEKMSFVWHRLQNTIGWDITTGKFPPGSVMPTLKELSHKYHVHIRTLNKALQALCEKDVIIRSGGGFAIPAYGGEIKTKRLVLLSYSWRSGKLTLGEIDSQFIRILESLCLNAGIEFDIVMVDSVNGKVSFRSQSDKKRNVLADSADILGYCYIVQEKQCMQEGVVRHLVNLPKPLAIFDCVGGWNISRTIKSKSLLKIFSLSQATKLGAAIASHLVQRGHIHVAYFSPTHKEVWSKKRFKAIQSAFREQSENRTDLRPFTLEMSESYGKIFSEIQDGYKTHPITLFNELMQRKPEGFRRAFNPVDVNRLSQFTLVQCEISRLMEPLFEKALRRKEITAWVTVNDATAKLARLYLNGPGNKSGKKISIVSIDNTMESLQEGMTSYDFNLSAIGSAVLYFITRPDSFHHSHQRTTVVIPGRIVTRASSL